MPDKLRLYAVHISPWSERARWVLQHHGLTFEKIEHVPFLGERRLRRLLGNPPGRVTVPVLITDQETLTDSWDIARYADRAGRGEKLLPPELEPDVRRWHDLGERSLAAGRELTIASMLAHPAAVDETLPPFIPRGLRPLLRPVARHGFHWFASKYRIDLGQGAEAQRVLREGLDALRTALVRSEYVLGKFSYADIIAASLLQGIVPQAERYLRMHAATRDAWTRPDLAAAYADLIAWRDRLYERHRRVSAPGVAAATPP